MPSRCPYCNKGYSYTSSFEKHLIARHPLIAQSYLDPQGVYPDDSSTELTENSRSYHEDYYHNGDDDFYWNTNSDDSDQESESDFNLNAIATEIEPDINTNDNNSTTINREPTSKVYKGAGRCYESFGDYEEEEKRLKENPWEPFKSVKEYKLARWFIRSKTSQGAIDDFFRSSLGPHDCSFSSGKSFVAMVEQMHSILGRPSWHHSEIELGGNKTSYFYRNPMTCVRYLLRQRAFKDNMVYAPTMEYNGLGERMFGEMHTGDWWWETQKTLPDGATVVPVICASDGTQLTNFSGDKKAWPIYLTIGNIKSTTWGKPSSLATILLALLPIPPKLGKDSNISKLQRRQSQLAFHKVLEEILEGLQSPGESGEFLDCADGYRRLCFPILAAWIADQEEHASLHNIQGQACAKCFQGGQRGGSVTTGYN